MTTAQALDYIFNQHSYKTISDRLGISISAVKTLKHRIKIGNKVSIARQEKILTDWGFLKTSDPQWKIKKP